MAKLHYTTAWIPSLPDCCDPDSIQEKVPFSTAVESDGEIVQTGIDISDGVGDYYYYIDLLLKKAEHKNLPDSRDIWIYVRRVVRFEDEKPTKKETYYMGTNVPNYLTKQEPLLKLKCIGTNPNGLIQYEYEIPPKASSDTGKHPLLNSSENITHAVYHAIKSFYHSHTHHDGEKDSILDPYPSDKSVDLSKPDNPALKHYQEQMQIILETLTDEVDFLDKKSSEYRKAKNFSQTLLFAQLFAQRKQKLEGFNAYFSPFLNPQATASDQKPYACNWQDLEKINKVDESFNEFVAEAENRTLEGIHKASENSVCENIESPSIKYENQDSPANPTRALEGVDVLNKILKNQAEHGETLNTTTGQLEALQGTAESLKTSVTNLDTAIDNAGKISKKWNIGNIILAAVSLGLGIFSYCSSQSAVSPEQLNKSIHSNNSTILHDVDSASHRRDSVILKEIENMIDRKHTAFLDSIKKIQSKKK